MNYHESVLLKESIEGLDIKPDGTYVDLTYGGGGHSKELLKHLNKGRLLAFDLDTEAEKNRIHDDRFIFIKQNFRFLKNFLRYYKIEQIDGIIADLGVSSHHFDQAERGFSFRFEGVLDMRMNQHAGITARDILNNYTENQLTQVFSDYGEVSNAYKIASLIVRQRIQQPVVTIQQFLEIISPCIPLKNQNQYLAKIFQALRIEVNKEIVNLKKMLSQTSDVIRKDGRLVVITYHSLEDRIVKNFIRSGNFEGNLAKDFYGNIITPFKAVNRNVILPSGEELNRNSRARSAKLRIAVKV
jgi:16S rRNA (cytosine1402-N4)-methyltransferase